MMSLNPEYKYKYPKLSTEEAMRQYAQTEEGVPNELNRFLRQDQTNKSLEDIQVEDEVYRQGLNEIHKITDGTPGNATQQPDVMINNSLNRSLNTSTEQKQQENGEDYIADDSNSPIQQGKMGWCFIGEDRGFRSCEHVGVNDQCMSGDIFPTKDVCINPNLRR